MILACGGWTSVSWDGLGLGLLDLLVLTAKEALHIFGTLTLIGLVAGAVLFAILALRSTSR